MSMKTVPEILEVLGGVTAVSNATGIPISTVHSWKRTGSVPRWRVPALIALAKRRGKKLAVSDFPCRQDAAA